MKHAKKHVKRFASLLLALVMVLSMSLSAFASSTGTDPAATGSITLDNTTSGETYNIYQIWDKDNTANANWTAFLESEGIINAYVTLSGNTVTWVENADYAAFAALALAYAQSDATGLKPGEEGYTSPKIDPTNTQTATGSTVAFSGLGFGAYLVDASNTLYVLNETDPNVEVKFGTVTIKNARPAETYDLYRILDLISYDTTTDTEINQDDNNLVGGKYSYKLNPDWNGFMEYGYTEGGKEIKVSQYLKYQTITVPGNPESEGEKAKDAEQPTDMVVWVVDNSTNEAHATFAKLALKFAKERKIKPVASHKIDGEAGNPNVDYKFTNLPLGWYLVDTSLGSLCSLDTTNPNVNIQEKNDVPQNTKEVKEDSGNNWGSDNDADVGQEVVFRSTIKVKNGTDSLLFHDTMSEGLTLLYNNGTEWDNAGEDDGATKPENKEDNLKITFSAQASSNNQTLVEGTHYNVVVDPKVKDSTGKDVSEGCTFHIEFLPAFFGLVGTGNHDVVVSYKAILNEKAQVGVIGESSGTLIENIAGNVNTSKVTYGDNNNSTPDSKTTTRTYEVPVWKYTGVGGARKGLSDTHFTIRINETGSKPLKLVVVDDGVKVKTNAEETPETDESGNQVKVYTQAVYRVATQDEINGVQTITNPEPEKVKIVTEIVTNESGRFKIQGLDRGSYLLEETQAKDGYNLLNGPVNVVIEELVERIPVVDQDNNPVKDETGQPKVDVVRRVVIKQNATAVTEIGIQNKSGSEMPSTGGIGTTIFYVLGSILLVGAAILLITKRRMSAEK